MSASVPRINPWAKILRPPSAGLSGRAAIGMGMMGRMGLMGFGFRVCGLRPTAYSPKPNVSMYFI